MMSLLIIATLAAAGANAEGPSHRRHVMTWVPPYAIDACKKQLNQSFDGIGMKDSITSIGLQFWNPTAKGGLKRVTRFGAINDSVIAGFRRWGNTHGIKVMLCVYNATESGWDWKLAQSAFDKNRSTFAASLVNKTVRLGLDGVDIDLEGHGNRNDEKASFVQFMKDLSNQLRAKKKVLTVNSFAYKWHAPNQTWWPDLLPHVDALHVMGYKETGAGARDWRAYDFIKRAAGEHASKIAIGVPSHTDHWQEKNLSKHLQWIASDPPVGLAIWDAQLKHKTWRTKSTRQAIAKLKNISKKILKESK